MNDVATADPGELDDEVNDERQSLETSAAELLAGLSEVTDVPSEFDPPPRALSASEIRFDSNEWMAAVDAIQGWLRLSEPLVLSEPLDFVRRLAEGLEVPPSDAAGTVDPAALSDVFVDRLRERADRASKLQQLFLEELQSEGGTTATATARWKEAWDEEPDAEESAEPVSAKAHTWAINEFSDRADRKRLNLSPSYQRGDVWPTTDSQLLIESILRGIPLPSVIMLRPDSGTTATALEVVDGKQRLTAILRFIGKHPRALERVRDAAQRHGKPEFLTLFADDYPKFRRLWKNLEGDQLTSSLEREFYFPFRLRTTSPAFAGQLAELAGKYYSQIKTATVYIADELLEISDVFERVTEYKIPVIEYTRATRKQIHEVFNLYNKQGKHLNAEEIRNAIYHEYDLMRGLLVAAGDNDKVDEVAPFLVPIWGEVQRLQQTLDDYSFGEARYRRTKVLSWLASLLFDASMDDGKPRKLSTSAQINFLLDRVAKNPSDPLRSVPVLQDAFTLLLESLEAHAGAADAWSSNLRGSAGAKWQEVPLIASTLGVALSVVALGAPEVEARLDGARADLAASSATKRWGRPRKTQTASQWGYIADVALLIMEQLGAGTDRAEAEMRRRFGFSCIETLSLVRTDDRDA